MVVVPKLAPVLLALTALVLAGCSGGGSPDDQPTGEEAPAVEATATTGGIRGVVVDDRITPVKGATVVVNPGNKTLQSDAQGLFVISGLDPGDYFVKASHPLYNEVQQTTTVVAGDSNPQALKLQLTRLIFAQPYATTEKFEGYIVCSAGHGFVGYSEECGEGAGSPADTCFLVDEAPVIGPLPCVPNPVFPGERLGGQGNNNVQYDFYVDQDDVRTIVVEMVWEPTAQTAASGQLLTYVSTDWLCDPFCGGNVFVRGGSGSPMYLRADVLNGTASNTTACDCGTADNITTSTKITAFTWANPDTTDPVTGEVPLATVILQQSYTMFVTKSYVLPLPDQWSFVGESPPPFT